MPRQLKQKQYEIGLPECIIVDIDGTLALHKTRGPYDYNNCIEDGLNVPIYDLVKMIQKCRDGITTIMVTGRNNQELKNKLYPDVKTMTEGWLHIHNIQYDQIYTRPSYSNCSDALYKKEIYEEHIKDKYNVLYVIEDRLKVIEMWRELGLTVLDVAGWDQ